MQGISIYPGISLFFLTAKEKYPRLAQFFKEEFRFYDDQKTAPVGKYQGKENKEIYKNSLFIAYPQRNICSAGSFLCYFV
jgi:hypothetical protein